MEVLKHSLPCENVSTVFGSYEADVVSINKSGMITEFEVKISRADFLADRKKAKWKFYELLIENRIPNRFYYVCPSGLIKTNEIPAFSGLLNISLDGEIEIIKQAPLIHRFKHDKNKITNRLFRILAERTYLGACRMTYENKKTKERNFKP